ERVESLKIKLSPRVALYEYSRCGMPRGHPERPQRVMQSKDQCRGTINEAMIIRAENLTFKERRRLEN
ncbi:MAG: hypothetical protein QXJ70_00830, partial [Acidilobaceae archaeon]